MLFRRARFDRELKEELQSHRAEREAAYVAEGLSPGEARRRAAIDFGNAAVIHEQSRDVWLIRWLESFRRDVRIAVRMLRRAPGFAIAAVATLALGIGANAAIFSVVDAVLLRPLPYADADRLILFGDPDPRSGLGSMGFETWLDYRASESLASTAMMRSWTPTLVVEGNAERVPAVRVSASYFSMMGVKPALGRDFTPADDVPDRWRVVILSDGLWRRRFGADPNVIGRVIRMNDRDFQIIGVLPPSFEPLDAARFYQPADMYAALGYAAGGSSACRSCQHLRALGRLRDGVTFEAAEAELNILRAGMAQRFPAEYSPTTRVRVTPLRDAIAGPVRKPLLILMGAVAFVLLIACANVASLLVARLMNRNREIALRLALGAGSGRLTSQLLIESLTLALAGGLCGIGLTALLLRGVAVVAPESLPRVPAMTLDARVLAFALGASLLTAIVFGLLPALRASHANLRGAISGGDTRTTTGNGGRARQLLVAADLALALILLAGAGLMLRSVSQLLTTSPGFDPSRVLTAQFSLVGQAWAQDAPVWQFQQRVLEEARALPGVESVALAGQVPLGGNGDSWGVRIEGRQMNPAETPEVERYSVTPDYLRTMRIPVVRGRDISESDSSTSEPVMLINEAAAAQLFPGEDPIGKRVRVGGGDRPWTRIVGITGDVKHETLDEAPRKQMYLPQSQFTDSFLVFVARARQDNAETLAPRFRDLIRRLDPTVPVYQVETMDALFNKAAGRQRFVMRLLVGFAAIALVLAAIGLYGVIAYTVARRSREVGVRLALGARRRDIVRVVLSGGSAAIGGGMLAGVAGALLTTRYLESMLFGVSARDVATLAAAAATLAIVAALAHLIPLRRALNVEPAIALRSE